MINLFKLLFFNEVHLVIDRSYFTKNTAFLKTMHKYFSSYNFKEWTKNKVIMHQNIKRIR